MMDLQCLSNTSAFLKVHPMQIPNCEPKNLSHSLGMSHKNTKPELIFHFLGEHNFLFAVIGILVGNSDFGFQFLGVVEFGILVLISEFKQFRSENFWKISLERNSRLEFWWNSIFFLCRNSILHGKSEMNFSIFLSGGNIFWWHHFIYFWLKKITKQKAQKRSRNQNSKEFFGIPAEFHQKS